MFPYLISMQNLTPCQSLMQLLTSRLESKLGPCTNNMEPAFLQLGAERQLNRTEFSTLIQKGRRSRYLLSLNHAYQGRPTLPRAGPIA